MSYPRAENFFKLVRNGLRIEAKHLCQDHPELLVAVNAQDENALHIAAGEGDMEMTKMLLAVAKTHNKMGIVTAINLRNQYPADVAREVGENELAKYIESFWPEHGARG